jgi:GT2 family glycosyltransferase
LAYPHVSIIILNWNRKDDTISCLHSIEKVNYPNLSVILVDNASSDGTVEAVKEKFPSVKTISNPRNLRFAGGNNVGIEYALVNKADFVLLLNNDTEVEPDFLSELVRFAENDSHTGIVGPKIYYYYDKKRIWFAGGKVDYWKGWISHIGIREMDHGQYDAAREVDYITGCCMLVRREVIEKIGKLDESYFIYGEDSDWCLRASRAGYRLAYVPSSVIWHKVSASSGGNLSWFKNWNKLKSQLRLMARYAKWYNWVTIPFGLVGNILKSVVGLRAR